MADSQNGGGITLAEIAETARSVWQALVAPTGLVIATGLWRAWQWVAKRRDVHERTRDETRDHLADVAARERQQLSTEMTAWLDRQEKQIASLSATADRLERERLTATERWIEARHAANNARTIANALEKRAGIAETVWAPWSWT